MTSFSELEALMATLGTRRQRLLELAGPSDLSTEDLVEELHELSQQLIIADEELRVQQQELDEARDAVLALSAERDVLHGHSTTASVVTDEYGTVVRATHAAELLIRQPQVRLTPRPLASWFEIDDRRTVRGMIGRAKASGEPQRSSARVRTSDGESLLVQLDLECVADVETGRRLLRWQLTPQETRLHSVPSADEPGTAPDPLSVLLQLGRAAEQLDACHTREDLLEQALELAVGLVPSAQDAGLVLREPEGAPDLVRGTSAALRDALRAEGGDHLTVGSDSRPDVAVLSVPLVHRERRLGALTVCGDRPRALERSAEVVLTALGSLVGIALHRQAEAAGLQNGMVARQLVGQAVGVLMERRRLTSEAAFAVLVRWSQHHNVKLRTIAKTLVETGQEPGAVPRP